MSTKWLAAMIALCCVPASGADWRLVWSDEFDKTGPPDAAKWNYEEGFYFNNEAQYYTKARPENVRVENGVLIIEARKERFANEFFREGSTRKREMNCFISRLRTVSAPASGR